MANLKLVLPTLIHQKQVEVYIKEHQLNNELFLHGTNGLLQSGSYDDWCERVNGMHTEKYVPEGLIPSSTYLAIDLDKDELVGFIDIRHSLNNFLLKCGGHIGYGVKPSARKKGYASLMLGLGLDKARKLGIKEKVLLTCDKDNEASRRTILSHHGILENEILEEGTDKIIQRYWIKL